MGYAFRGQVNLLLNLERETGIEPATNGLGSRYSTIELLPLQTELYLAESSQRNPHLRHRSTKAQHRAPISAAGSGASLVRLSDESGVNLRSRSFSSFTVEEKWNRNRYGRQAGVSAGLNQEQELPLIKNKRLSEQPGLPHLAQVRRAQAQGLWQRVADAVPLFAAVEADGLFCPSVEAIGARCQEGKVWSMIECQPHRKGLRFCRS